MSVSTMSQNDYELVQHYQALLARTIQGFQNAPSQQTNVQPRHFKPQQAYNMNKPPQQQQPINPNYLAAQWLQQMNDFSSQPAAQTQQFNNSSVPAFPSQPCISIQRRESVKSDTSSPDSARYKTEMCRPFEETGQCRYGSKCQFAHGRQELRSLNRHPRYKSEFCRTFHTTGFCSYGQRCNFIHNEDERRAPSTATQRPPTLYVSNSTGSSPASSVNGDLSPSYSDDVFPSRLSPTLSFSSVDSGCPSPPGSPRHNVNTDALGLHDLLHKLSL